MNDGLEANYQTQFSFVNKVDNFYINFLRKNSIKIDLYVSVQGVATQVGHSEIPLKDLVGNLTADNNTKNSKS